MPTIQYRNDNEINQNDNSIPEDKNAEIAASAPSHSLHSNHIMRLLVSESRQNEAIRVFLYAFADIDVQEVMRVIKTIKNKYF